MGFHAPNSGWLSSWGLGIGLLEQSGSLSLVVPWFDISHLFEVVVWLPFCPTPPILTAASSNKGVFVYTENMLFSTAAFINRLS